VKLDNNLINVSAPRRTSTTTTKQNLDPRCTYVQTAQGQNWSGFDLRPRT
jgi:hypothetical protein